MPRQERQDNTFEMLIIFIVIIVFSWELVSKYCWNQPADIKDLAQQSLDVRQLAITRPAKHCSDCTYNNSSDLTRPAFITSGDVKTAQEIVQKNLKEIQSFQGGEEIYANQLSMLMQQQKIILEK